MGKGGGPFPQSTCYTPLPGGGGESLTADPVGISCPFSVPLLGLAWFCVYCVAPEGPLL